MSHRDPKHGELYIQDNSGETTIETKGEWVTVGAITSEISAHQRGWTKNGAVLVCDAGSGGVYDINGSFSISVPTANQDIEIAIFKNGVLQPNIIVKRKLASLDTASCSLSGKITAKSADNIFIRVRNLTSTVNVLFVHANYGLTRI